MVNCGFWVVGPTFLRDYIPPSQLSTSIALRDGPQLAFSFCAQVCGYFCGDTQTGQNYTELWHGWLDSRLVSLLWTPPETMRYKMGLTCHLWKQTKRDSRWSGWYRRFSVKIPAWICGKRHSLRTLFLGVSNGLQCVGRRLAHTSYPASFKHQVIFPNRHPITNSLPGCHRSEEGDIDALHILAAARQH